MAKKPRENKVRTITCAISGKQFTYDGHGRPPKYHPDHAAEAIALNRKRRRDAAKAKAVERAATHGVTIQPVAS